MVEAQRIISLQCLQCLGACVQCLAVARFPVDPDVHAFQRAYQGVVGYLPVVQPQLHQAEDQKGNEANKEMGLDPFALLVVDGPRLEVGLHYPEAVFDLPSEAVDPEYFLDVVLEVRGYGVKAVVFLLRIGSGAVQAQLVAPRYHAIAVHGAGEDESPDVVGAEGHFAAADHLLGPGELLQEYPSLVDEFLQAESDDYPFALFAHVVFVDVSFLDRRPLDVGKAGAARGLLAYGSVFREIGLAPVPQVPPVQVLEDQLRILSGKPLQRLGHDIRPVAEAVEPPRARGAQAGIRAIDELRQPVVLYYPLLQRGGGRLLVGVAGVYRHGQRQSVPVDEQPHLDDGVGPMLLADAVFPQPLRRRVPVFLLDLEEIVGAVVIEDRLLPSVDPLRGPVQVRLQRVRQLVKDVHAPVDVVQSEVEVGQVGIHVVEGGKLGLRGEDARENQQFQDVGQVILDLALRGLAFQEAPDP